MKFIVLPMIWVYKHSLSPIFRVLGVRCRFYPSCADYAAEVFKKHPFLKAFSLTVKRISRCHPWGGSGMDLPPE